MDSPQLALAAKLLGIAGPLACAGYQYCAAMNVVPRLYSEPARVSTPIFKHVFHTGSAHIIPVAAVAVACHAFLAYQANGQVGSASGSSGAGVSARALYLGAAVATVSTGLLTAIVMGPGIKRLIEISDSSTLQDKVAGSGEHLALLRTWVAQSLLRGLLFASAGFAALWAALAHP